MKYEDIVKHLKQLSNPDSIKGMERFGINPTNNLGISIYKLRELAKVIGKDHQLALKLWDSGIHDARLLACFVEEPHRITGEQMDAWANDFDSWDICDQACISLFDSSPLAWKKIFQWAECKKEFVKRGAFALLAGLAVHDKKASNNKFEQYSLLMKENSVDDRNYVKKAINWALRNIGKRNISLNKKMINLAEDLLTLDSTSAKWIASDAITELTSEKVQMRIRNKKRKETK
jgi:3-methyladenine DNA glycosylase AlkD